MQTNGINEEMYQLLSETEIETFLTRLQNYLTRNKHFKRKYNKVFYRNLPLLDKSLLTLNEKEKRLLRVKVNSIIAYLEDINNISSPSPFIVGVFTAVISLVFGVMIKDFNAYPAWTIGMIILCFVLLIPGISWFTLDQSGRNAELKEILTNIKELVS